MGIRHFFANGFVQKKWESVVEMSGLKTNAWTVNKADDLRWCIDQGIDFITTNEPELLQQLLKGN